MVRQGQNFARLQGRFKDCMACIACTFLQALAGSRYNLYLFGVQGNPETSTCLLAVLLPAIGIRLQGMIDVYGMDCCCQRTLRVRFMKQIQQYRGIQTSTVSNDNSGSFP